jgi:hypothetical protein
MAVADDGFLQLQRGVFGHRQVTGHQRGQRRAARLAQQQRALRVDVDEDDLHRGAHRGVAGDDFAHAVEDDLQPPRQVRQRGFGGANGAAGDVADLVAVDFDHAEAGALQPGVDAENAALHGCKLAYQRAEWKNTGAAKHSGATRSSRPTAPVTELWLPQ